MDRNAKLRTTSGTTNIHQQSSPLSYHKYREIHYNIKRLKAELNLKPEPRLLEGAFGRACRRHRIDGNKTDPDTFFRIIRNLLIDMLRKESRTGAVRSQTTTWIRFRKDDELIELAFNSRMMNVYNLSDIGEIVDEMIAHMREQIENPALANSRFIFDEVLHIDTDFHQLNLTRGSSYIPLPDLFAHKKAIINPKNEDLQMGSNCSFLLGRNK